MGLDILGVIAIYKSCSRCGKIHDTKYRCTAGSEHRIKYDYEEAKLRNTYKWHTKAEQIKKDSKYLCAVCFDEGIYNYNELEVHHITKIKEDKSLLLDNFNLICLCRKHHKLADAGMIKKEYLQELAKKRETEGESWTK